MKNKHVVTLDVAALMKRPQHRTPEDIACLQHILLKVKFMPTLPPESLIGIAKQLEHRLLPAGATIIRQGDIGEELFVILRGVVLVMMRDANSVENQVAELKEGCLFGELALLEENSRRRATCICKEECSFAVIHKKVYDELLREQSGKVLEDKMHLISLVPVLRDVPKDAMRSLMLCATEKQIVPGTILLQQDQEVEDLYIIVRGNIKHIRELPQSQAQVSETADFWKHDQSDPFTKPRVASSKFSHVKSPVAAYMKESSSKLRTHAQRKALVKSGVAKLRRAVAKILDAQEKGLLRVINGAAKSKSKLSPSLARAFQASHRIEQGDRLFLEIASASRGDYFGEASLCKVPKSSTSVIASSAVTVLVIHKWDILNSIDASILAELPRFSVVGNIDEELLVEQFYRHMRWETFRTEMVTSVLREREIEKMVKPKFIWQVFRSTNPGKKVGVVWM